MSKRFIFHLLFCCMMCAMQWPAQSLAQKHKQGFICDSLTPLSPPELIVAAYKLGDCMVDMPDIDSAKKLVQILDLDVVGYFELSKLYDTEASRNQFMQTSEYKSKLAQLTIMKAENLKHLYVSVLTENLGTYSWGIKGFKFDMDNLSTPGGLKEAPPPPQTLLYSVELSSIPFAAVGADQSVTISVLPDSGMSIVRDMKDIKTIVIYKPGNLYDKEYTYYNGQCHCNRQAKEKVIKTLYDRVIIFNSQTNDVYWDVIYDKH